MPRGRPWTDEQVATLRRMKEQGLSVPECARALRRTEDAIINATRHYNVLLPFAGIPAEKIAAAIFAEWRENVRAVADGHDPFFAKGRYTYVRHIRELAGA